MKRRNIVTVKRQEQLVVIIAQLPALQQRKRVTPINRRNSSSPNRRISLRRRAASEASRFRIVYRQKFLSIYTKATSFCIATPLNCRIPSLVASLLVAPHLRISLHENMPHIMMKVITRRSKTPPAKIKRRISTLSAPEKNTSTCYLTAFTLHRGHVRCVTIRLLLFILLRYFPPISSAHRT